MKDFSNDKEYITATEKLWNFLALRENIENKEADAIFVFGGFGKEIPNHATQLYFAKKAPKILITGNSGVFTQKFNKPEAITFQEQMLKQGVRQKDVILDLQATNTGENVIYGMRKLKEYLNEVNSLILVSRPFIMKRCVATFAKHFPRVKTFPSPPPGNILTIIDRSRLKMAERLISELDRLEEYHERGFIEPVSIPQHIKKARKSLQHEIELNRST